MPRFITSLLTLLFLLPSLSFAQAPTSPTSPLSCFDLYRFGSVAIDLFATIGETIPGATVTFVGKVTNENPYPVLDGTLSMKVFRRSETTFTAGDGNELVDTLIVADAITLPAGGSRDVTATWQVPTNAAGGEYYAAFFYTTSDRYNLSGLPFTDDVVGSLAPFSIISDATPATFRKDATTINGEDHAFAAFPPSFSAGEPVTIEATITNPTDTAKTLPLQWNQYAWSHEADANHRHTTTELITIPARSDVTVSYTLRPQRDPVHFVTATTQDIDAKSLLHIRLIREGIDDSRLNFPSLSTFPLAANQSHTLFSCAHATVMERVPDHTLTLTLTDRDGKTIHSYTYAGDLTTTMGGYGDTFTPDRPINYAVLTATLTRSGTVVEETTLTYDCEQIDPTTCLSEPETPRSFLDTLKDNAMTLILTLLILLGLFFGIRHYRRHHGPHITAGPTPLALLFLTLFIPTLFFTGVGEVGAQVKSVVWSNNLPSGYPDFYLDTDITYRATARNMTSGGALLADGATVPVGHRILFAAEPFYSTDITWVPGGNAGIFLYPSFMILDAGVPRTGYFIPAAGVPGSLCASSDVTFIATTIPICIGSGFWGSGGGMPPDYCLGTGSYLHYTPISVNPPTLQFTQSGTATLSCNPSGDDCTVTSPGTVITSVRFLATKLVVYPYSGSSLGACVSSVYSGPIPYVIPPQTITFTLNAIAGNNPPNPPTLNGPATGSVGTPYIFDFTASDPDGDTLRYGIADATCTTVSEWIPGAGYVPSNTNRDTSFSWGVPGTYTVYVLAEDSKGARSTCSSRSIDISAAPPPTADLKVNGGDTDISVPKNTTINLSWTSSGAPTCSKWGGTWGSGESIATAGGPEPTLVTTTSTYLINCGGAIDQITVTVVNQPPNAPTITGPNPVPAGTHPYTLLATDPDGDTVYYEVDVNLDGITDTTTAVVPSGTGAIANVLLALPPGSKTFQGRTVDQPGGLTSAWVNHTVTVSPPPPPSVTLEASVNGGPYSSSNQTINPGDTVTLRWDSPTADSCTATAGTGFSTGGSRSGTDPVTDPPPGTSDTFTIVCSNAGGDTPDDITITTNTRPDLNQPNVTHTLSPGFDPVTGEYDSVTITFSTQNVGGSGTVTDPPYRLRFDKGDNGSWDVTETGAVGILSSGQTSVNHSETFFDIPFGPNEVEVIVDQPNTIVEGDETNNTRLYTFGGAIPPPNPGLDITADRYQIRQGETVTLSYTRAATYFDPSLCRVYGPNLDFVPAAIPGSRVTGAITAKSLYTFSCTIAGTTFSDSVTVETIGEIEEI